MFLDEKRTGEEPSLIGLIHWLEKQNPNTAYNWDCTEGNCLMGLYGKSMGLTYTEMCLPRSTGHPYYERCNDRFGGAPYSGSIAISHPRTFGGALERARICLQARQS
jgi:hypothetical protein